MADAARFPNGDVSRPHAFTRPPSGVGFHGNLPKRVELQTAAHQSACGLYRNSLEVKSIRRQVDLVVPGNDAIRDMSTHEQRACLQLGKR